MSKNTKYKHKFVNFTTCPEFEWSAPIFQKTRPSFSSGWARPSLSSKTSATAGWPVLRSGFSSPSHSLCCRHGEGHQPYGTFPNTMCPQIVNLKLSYFDESIHSHLIIGTLFIQPCLIDCQLKSCSESLNILVPNFKVPFQQSAPKPLHQTRLVQTFLRPCFLKTLLNDWNLPLL